jgi:hypothetical protein
MTPLTVMPPFVSANARGSRRAARVVPGVGARKSI